MIRKLLRRVFRRAAPANTPPEPAVIPVARHGVRRDQISPAANKVCTTLQEAGHKAFVVGGAVRDIIVGQTPKDFDVATSATPEEVRALFRRSRIIGRRFKIVHVMSGPETIEVSTFRAMQAAESTETDEHGRVLRDNVFGSMAEDATRRDFTVNALYYDPRREIVVDYHHGIDDAKRRLLRMIGDPETRYREDPVRIIRVVRFAAKLGFEIDTETRKPILRMADLLANVPASRLFDEMIKLLQTGHALASLEELRRQGLHRGIFPILDAVLDDAHRHDGREKFIHQALADTDRRVNEGKAVAPSFMLACMLWHDVVKRRDKLRQDGEQAMPALLQAIDQVFDARIGDISGRGKLAADMREIWTMQPRFERRTPNAAESLLAQPRFRAGFDFLRLRADAGEADEALAQWWEEYSLADPGERPALLEAARDDELQRRSGGAPVTSASAPAKKRRRRRKPGVGRAGSEADAAPGGAGAPSTADD